MAYQLTIYNYKESFTTLPNWTTNALALLFEKPLGLISVISESI
jgi:hypothetical protein